MSLDGIPYKMKQSKKLLWWQEPYHGLNRDLFLSQAAESTDEISDLAVPVFLAVTLQLAPRARTSQMRWDRSAFLVFH